MMTAWCHDVPERNVTYSTFSLAVWRRNDAENTARKQPSVTAAAAAAVTGAFSRTIASPSAIHMLVSKLVNDVAAVSCNCVHKFHAVFEKNVCNNSKNAKKSCLFGF